MTFEENQKAVHETAEYPEIIVSDQNRLDAITSDTPPNNIRSNYIYPALGLAGEAGEVVEKIKKVVRNNNGVINQKETNEIFKEIGDVFWYCTELINCLGGSIEEVLQMNLDKLKDRSERNMIKSQGDNR